MDSNKLSVEVTGLLKPGKVPTQASLTTAPLSGPAGECGRNQVRSWSDWEMLSFQEQQLIRLNVEGDVMASLTPRQRLAEEGKTRALTENQSRLDWRCVQV